MTEMIPTTLALPAIGENRQSSGWWGVAALIVTEAALFGYLLFTYFYLAAQTQSHWPPDGLPMLLLPAVNTFILLASSGFVWLSERCIRHQQRLGSTAAMALAFCLGVCFVAIQLNEWKKQVYDMTTNLYGSLYFTITGFHMLHVVVGLIILSMLLLWIALGYFDDRRNVALTIGGLYRHFVDVVWLFVFTTLYLTPYLF
ncbi:MAG: cytochrome c oxidase subunit 3 [Methylomonas sp.]